MEDSFKDIIIDSLQFLSNENRINLHAFCIMSNHIHLIWQPKPPYSLVQIQSSLMRHTAKGIISKLRDDKVSLDIIKVDKHDREHQIWNRDPLSIELFSPRAFLQKILYVHANPVKAGLITIAENYKYSSARFYKTGYDEFNMLKHYLGH